MNAACQVRWQCGTQDELPWKSGESAASAAQLSLMNHWLPLCHSIGHRGDISRTQIVHHLTYFIKCTIRETVACVRQVPVRYASNVLLGRSCPGTAAAVMATPSTSTIKGVSFPDNVSEKKYRRGRPVHRSGLESRLAI
jgi:hypothetical protein